MNRNLSQWLRDALDHSGLNQARLAEELGERLGRPMYRSKVNKMVAGTRAISASEMIAISEVTGYAVPAQSVPGLSEETGAYEGGGATGEAVQDPRGPGAPLRSNDLGVTIRDNMLIGNAAVDKRNIARLRRMIDAMEKVLDDDAP